MVGQTESQSLSEHDEFGAMVAANRVRLLRLALALSKSRVDADDLVQETLLRAWRKRELYDAARGSALSWLATIAVDLHRQRWRRATSRDDLPPDLSLPAAEAPSAAHRLDVREHVGRLPPRQRTTIILFYYVDLSVDDIARLMDRAPGTVKSALHDERKLLADRLGATYDIA